jgi:hypothetical protein
MPVLGGMMQRRLAAYIHQHRWNCRCGAELTWLPTEIALTIRPR